MNPVDHPHGVRTLKITVYKDNWLTQNRVVIINILVRRRLSRDMLCKVKRQVSLLLGELVCYVVPRRLRTRGISLGVEWTFFAWGT